MELPSAHGPGGDRPGPGRGQAPQSHPAAREQHGRVRLRASRRAGAAQLLRQRPGARRSSCATGPSTWRVDRRLRRGGPGARRAKPELPCERTGTCWPSACSAPTSSLTEHAAAHRGQARRSAVRARRHAALLSAFPRASRPGTCCLPTAAPGQTCTRCCSTASSGPSLMGAHHAGPGPRISGHRTHGQRSAQRGRRLGKPAPPAPQAQGGRFRDRSQAVPRRRTRGVSGWHWRRRRQHARARCSDALLPILKLAA